MAVIKSTALIALCLSCTIVNVTKAGAIYNATKAGGEPEPIVVCKADIVFCVDNSGSIEESAVNGTSNWKFILDFLVAVAQRLSISQDGTHVGLITFGNKGYFEFDLNKYQTEPEVTASIKNLTYRAENTNMTGGMQMARTILTSQALGARAGIPKVLILFTDGKPTYDADKLPQEVNLIKSLGIRIVAVGVTNQINETQLKSMASTPQDYVYSEDVNALQYIVNLIPNNNTCQPVPSTTTPTTTTTTTPTTTITTTTPTTTTRTSPTTTTTSTTTTLTTSKTTTTPTTTTPTTTTTPKPTPAPITRDCDVNCGSAGCEAAGRFKCNQGECISGYGSTSSLTCAACPSNCQTCSKDAKKCDSCKTGFQKDGKGDCIATCDDNCSDCGKNGKCSKCKKGNPADGSCACSSNCKKCDKAGPGNCDSCINGYINSGGKGCKRLQ